MPDVDVPTNHRYRIGDELKVTGDAAGWGQHFDVDTVVRVDGYYEYRGAPGYRCVSVENPSSYRWNVAESDLEVVVHPVTDEEMAEVYEILGRTPAKACCIEMDVQLDQHAECGVHDNPWDCDTTLMSTQHGVGIPVRDGGSSYINISYCPWCGAKL